MQQTLSSLKLRSKCWCVFEASLVVGGKKGVVLNYFGWLWGHVGFQKSSSNNDFWNRFIREKNEFWTHKSISQRSHSRMRVFHKAKLIPE